MGFNVAVAGMQAEGFRPSVPGGGSKKPGLQNFIDALASGTFSDKIKAARKLFDDAKLADPKFFAQEARSLKGDFLFIGSGRVPGLKNVMVIRPDGSVLRMEFDPTKLIKVPGGDGKIFDVDLSCADRII